MCVCMYIHVYMHVQKPEDTSALSYCYLPHAFETGYLTEPGLSWWPESPSDATVIPHSMGITGVLAAIP